MKVKLSGHLGDAIFTLAVIRNMGGKHDLVLTDSENVLGAFLPIAPAVVPLMKLQPYVKSVTLSNTAKYDLDTTDFRRLFHNRTHSLLSAQIAEVERVGGTKISHDTSPWISNVEPHSYSYDRIIVARSPRYRNHYFPWKELVQRFGDRMLFVGGREEHRDFQDQFGGVEYYITKDLLEVGQLIAGSGIFIGNQSSPHAVAMGMGVQILQETSPYVPDCIFQRDNVQYVTTGQCSLEGYSFGSKEIDADKVSTYQTPPGMWRYDGEKRHDLDDLTRTVCGRCNIVDFKATRRKIIIANVHRCQDFFQGVAADTSVWKEAFANAGLKYPEPS